MSTRPTLLVPVVLFALMVRPAAAEGDAFPTAPDTEPSATRALPPAEAAARFRAPEGFHVGVFAAEPDVRNPVALCWDPRGRLWVAENYTYAEAAVRFDPRLRDRVLIFEDADGDGRFDRRTVFTDDVQKLTSVAVGLGGVWVTCPPQLLFFPDRDGDDRPDGPAEVVLDGFATSVENHHTFANGLKWGPDGWLYGRCGASSPAEVGAPGTPAAQRIPVRGGVWRYHPRTRRFEAITHGTTNPWGQDWDARGESFFINTVTGHLWHLIPGSHLTRSITLDPNPRAYGVIDQHGDHYHWDRSRPLKHGPDESAGGGHAHVGLMIYQAGQWPAPYRGELFTLNLHGRRVNAERLERHGSGFVGRHAADMLFSADPWFRGIDLTYGPDGAVYLLDWSDTGECHEHDGVHRSSGRVFKVTYGTPAPAPAADLRALDERALVGLHRHSNVWFVRQARRVLADRADRGEPLTEARALLRGAVERGGEPVARLRAIWTLNAIGGAGPDVLRPLLRDGDESLRAWAVRLLTDAWPIDTVFSRRVGPDVDPPADLLSDLERLGREDPSGLVRLALASTLQRLPVNRRLPLASALASHAGDADDHNIPAVVWTGLIPVADADPGGLVAFAAGCELPEVVRWSARRLAEDADSNPGPLDALLRAATDRPVSTRAEVVAGLTDALNGRHRARKPSGWDAFAAALGGADPSVRDRARDLGVVFGDGRALDEVRRVALDDGAPLAARRAALAALIDARPADLRVVCTRLLKVRFLNSVAARGLAQFDDPEVGRALAAGYRAFHPTERAAAMGVLVSRPSFARALLDKVAAGTIPRADLTPYHARQVRGLGDPALVRRLAEVWGELRDTPTDRLERIASLKRRLDPGTLAAADLGRGRRTFERVCASCHTLYGRGGDVGPDLTGSGRDNLDYLLENVVDPSASVPADFRVSAVALHDGRVLNGLIRPGAGPVLTLQTATERVSIDRADIEEIAPSSESLMPSGLLDQLSPSEARDLLAYLMHRVQVPLPDEP